jgi:hypothetical protein
MTLITRLSAAFTDTTLPILRKDPVLPVTSLTVAGDRVLYDWKNVGTWPSQATTINAGDKFFSLADPSVVGIGDGVAANIAATYDPVTGRVSTATFPGLQVEDNYDDIFSDPTADYVVSLWMSRDVTAVFPQLGTKGIGDLNSNTHSFVLYGGNNTTSITWYHPNSTDNDARVNTVNFSSVTLGTMNRYGVHWTKSSGSWRIRGVLNNNTPGAYQSLSHGTSANGIQLNSNWMWRFRAESTSDIARLYVENLTVSGRTAEEVWAADWARGNGRFS